MTQFFFELLQVAIGNRRELSRRLSADDWEKLRLVFKKHALLGVGYVGITKLPKEYTPPLPVLAQWVHNAEKIKNQNNKVSVICERLCRTYGRDGFDCCILKGQGNYPYYIANTFGSNEDIHIGNYRTPGDVDIWCSPKNADGVQIAVGDGKSAEYTTYKGKEAVVEYVNMKWGLKELKERAPRYLHIDAPEEDGIPIEVHLRPSFLNDPIYNHRLQKWYKENVDFETCSYETSGKQCTFQIPSVSFNVVFQMTHIYKHILDEGIGLRQILDYYFVLRSLHIEQVSLSNRAQNVAIRETSLGRSVLSNTQLMHLLDSFGMKRFAGALMWVLGEVFSMPSAYMICNPNDDTGRFLLDEILTAGNFGHYDPRLQELDVQNGRTSYQVKRALRRMKRNLRFITSYPQEVIFEPYARLTHFWWRKFKLWRF